MVEALPEISDGDLIKRDGDKTGVNNHQTSGLSVCKYVCPAN